MRGRGGRGQHRGHGYNRRGELSRHNSSPGELSLFRSHSNTNTPEPPPKRQKPVIRKVL